MVSLTQLVSLAVLGVAGVVLVALSVVARRRWDEPAGVSFSVLVWTAGILAVGAVAGYAVGSSGEGATTAMRVAFTLLLVYPFIWLVFTLEYLGWNRYVRGRYLAVLGFPAVLALGNMFYSMAAPPAEGPRSLLTVVLNYTTAMVLFGGVGLVVVLALLTTRAGLQYEFVGRREGATLAIAASVLPIAILVVGAVTRQSVAGLSHAVLVPSLAAAWGVSATGFLAAYGYYDIFDAMPATSTVGTDMVVAEIDDPVIVVDADECVLEVNPEAEATFGLDDGVIERSLVEVLGYSAADLRLYDDVELPTVDGRRLFEVAVSELSDQHDRPLGDLLVFHDVTERQRREQRLTVLNRVLRHNLRNDMTAVLAWAELIADGRDPEQFAGRIHDSAVDIVEISDKAREIEQLMSVDVDPERVTALRSVVDRVVETARDDNDGWSAGVDVDPSLTVRADGRVLEPVLQNLVENAVEHNDADEPRVTIAATTEGDSVRVTVTDNGPGIPDHERTAIQEGEETALEHGTGLGLWTVRWGVTKLGGELAFGDNDPRGTVVELTLPAGTTSPEALASSQSAVAAADDD